MPLLRRPARGGGTANVISGSTMFGPVVQAGVVNIQGPLPAVALPAQIRPAISGFTGRERELGEVLTFLGPGPAPRPGPRCASSPGWPGVGKTELARQAGESAAAQGWFPGGVVDLDLHGYDDAPLSAEQALDSALQGLGVPSESIPAAGALRAALYRAEIAARDPVLLVADSAADPEQIRALVPAGTRHRLLVTSRHTMAQLDARLIELRVLDKAEALDLLESAIRGFRPEDSRITDDQPSAGRLAESAGTCRWPCRSLRRCSSATRANRSPNSPPNWPTTLAGYTASTTRTAPCSRSSTCLPAARSAGEAGLPAAFGQPGTRYRHRRSCGTHREAGRRGSPGP